MQDETQKHVSKIHVIEDRELSREQKRNNKRPNKDNNNKDNEKANAGCQECNKLGQKKRDCTIWKHKHGLNNQKAKTKDNFTAMIIGQINIVQSDNNCWDDLVASKHVCKESLLLQESYTV